MKDPKFLAIQGRRWTFKRPLKIVESNGDETWGYCTNPIKKRKTIAVSQECDDWRELNTLVHEVIHAGAYDQLKETYVATTANNVSHSLWDSGYRRQQQHSRRDNGKKQLIEHVHGQLIASAFHVLDEAFVESMAGDLGVILWRFGYRKVSNA
jgi:hypothetical protein